METKKNSDNNENAHLELVLEEFISEQKSQAKSINDLAGAINSLSDRFVNVEVELSKSKPISVSTNMQPIQEMIKKSLTDIKCIVATESQKSVVKKIQLLLFPEQDARLFYKIVFGRWFMWLVIMLFLTNLYNFGIHWNDNQKEIKLQVLEHDHLKKSWNNLYLKGGKVLRKVMDSVYFKTEIIEN
jgi:hypothetical protein